jgi:acyl carrier protein
MMRQNHTLNEDTDKAQAVPHPAATLISVWEDRMNQIAEKDKARTEIPLTRALKQTDQSSRTKSMGRLVLRDDTADRVSELWGAILGIQPPRDRNFFELGGDSCKAIELMASIRKEFHVEMGLRSLFEAPTIEGMCGRIKRLQSPNKVDA